MTAKECCAIIANANIRPTSIRILVYEAISNLHDTFSLSDLESILDTVDKSSIFRALSVFSEHNLIHSVDDGSGYMKYCLCHNHGECREEESHCHFYCELCNKTYCLENDALPNITLPPNFVAKHINYVIKGTCAACTSKQK